MTDVATVANPLCDFCGRRRDSATEAGSTHCNAPFDVQPHRWTGAHPAHTSRGDFLTHLREVNSARLAAWEGDNPASALFHAVELGGEAGEVLNVAKKLHREEMGWRGSRASLTDLADELADVIICVDKMAIGYGIDLAEATARKFNATSEKNGFPHRLAVRSHLLSGEASNQALTSTPPVDEMPQGSGDSAYADRRQS